MVVVAWDGQGRAEISLLSRDGHYAVNQKPSSLNRVYVGFGDHFEVYRNKIAGQVLSLFLFEHFRPKPQSRGYFTILYVLWYQLES
jgi:hypothetical protein